MSMLWVVLLVALTGSRLGYGLPVRPTPQTYPHDGQSLLEAWTSEGGLYAAIPALALVIVALAFLLGCTWCYRHKDCKPNEGADNQLFTASASQIHTPQRQPQPPDSGFSEPVNNNVGGEDNNNGPISLREMQNIANNNAGAYIFNENEERNANRFTNSRESIVLFDPLPVEIHVDDPLEPYSEWFTSDHFPRNNLQYLREIGRGWFGRVVGSEVETESGTQMVAVKILNQNASLEDKARFLEETRIYRELKHDQILQFLGKCLEEEPWLLIFELCTMDLQRYLIVNRPRMAILNESGLPLQLMSDVSSALAYMHTHGFTYGYLWGGSVLVRGQSEEARAVLGRYEVVDPQHDCFAPEVLRRGAVYTTSSEIWSLGTLIWEVCSWGSIPTGGRPSPPPELPCPYKNHLYQVMQLCWNMNPDERPTAAQVHALINHLHSTHTQTSAHSDMYANSDFEDRWQRLKPNSIPKVDEHVAIVHAPSTSTAHFTESEHNFDNTLSVDMDTAVSRSSSIMSDKDPLDSQIKSESLTNLHGSLEDVGNIYLTHNETAALECNQGNLENDKSDSSVDPWLKEIIAGSQDDVSYYRDVSDVIKNLDNILNSEKTSSSESSHQASPSRDNLSLDCKKDYPVQSSMVKSPGISNFQHFLDTGSASKDKTENDDELDRDTIGTLSHSFERHSDTTSQHTLENLTPDTPLKDLDFVEVANQTEPIEQNIAAEPLGHNDELPKLIADNKVPKLTELCVVSNPSLSETLKEQLIVKDCKTSCDSIRTDNEGTKSLVDVVNTESMPLDKIEITKSVQEKISPDMQVINVHSKNDEITSKSEEVTKVDETPTISEKMQTETDDYETEDELKTETDELRTKTEEQTKVDDTLTKTETDVETVTDEVLTETDEVTPKSEEIEPKDDILPMNIIETSNEIDTLPSVTDEVSNATEAAQLKLDSFEEPETTESENNYSKGETISLSDLIDIPTESFKKHDDKTDTKENSAIMLEPDKVQKVIETILDESQKNHDSVVKTPVIIKSNETNIEGTIHNNQETTNEKIEKIDTIQIKNQSPVETVNVNLVGKDNENENFELLDNKQAVVDVKECVKSIAANQEPIDSKVENVLTEMAKETIDFNLPGQSNLINHTPVSNIENISVDKNKDRDSKIEIDQENVDSIEEKLSTTPTDLPPSVQNNATPLVVNMNEKILDNKNEKVMHRSDSDYVDVELNQQSYDSTVYMDLIYNTNSQIINNLVDNSEVYKDNIETTHQEKTPESNHFKDDSTVYMDLPSFEAKKVTDAFLQSERANANIANHIFASTPIASDNSVDTVLTLENSTKENETLVLPDVEYDPKAPDYGPGVTVTKLEQKYVPESMSPFDSPTKSHHTDTFDENSSVVLGSFENCSLELFKGIKTTLDNVEIPREEILAFSSNFSEINLETPSPLRDVNFLNEVPDIIPDDIVFDDLATISEPKDEVPSSESGPSGTEKRVSPSTPPNSPGVFPSTSEPKYIVDIDLNPPEPDSISLRDVIELNQIELQITSKLAMAENENNFNIEYSGPLTVEGLIEESGSISENNEVPESFLAGNGEALDDLRDHLSLDEECVKALRNELELKLPLAQVASIEPQLEGDGEWPSELPPPPELVVSYPGALSPIQEETGQQLSAYDNDLQWNPSTRTDSSESYPEPCNNSTDEVTELPTGHQEHTYTMPSRDNSHSHNTYTICKEAVATSRDLSMSADSLNASPLKLKDSNLSPIDDQTFVKEDEKECERISQVSPYLVSPTTDTPGLDTSDNTGVSTSKTTLPTDAKHSKPECQKNETQCVSLATSIDSWCSNDTLYNVEENFDDLAVDECAGDFAKDEANSESTDTLTHNDDDKELSHCSTYLIHDSKSENCETFSPDSITANDNYTYTKVKEAITTPSATDVNDSSKHTTKDLAYGSLMSGVPSHSNCSTEATSELGDPWRLQQPELVRKSPVREQEFSPSVRAEEKDCNETSPKTAEHSLKKMDSIEISCLQDNLTDTDTREHEMMVVNDSPHCVYRNMTPSVTSTPFAEELANEDVSPILLVIPDARDPDINVSSFLKFQQSAEIRPQDLSNENVTNQSDGSVLLEGDSKTLREHSTSNSLLSDPNYTDFEISVTNKPQDLNSRSSQSLESGVSSGEFTHFENSVRFRPQDLSSPINASSMLLTSERMSGELAMISLSPMDLASQSNITHLTSQNSIQTSHSNIILPQRSAQNSIQSSQSIVMPDLTSENSNQINQSNDMHDLASENSNQINYSNVVVDLSRENSKQTGQSNVMPNLTNENSNTTSEINVRHDLSNLTNENSNLTSQSNVIADLSDQFNCETRETKVMHDLSNLTNENSNQTSQSNVMADLSGQINIETSETNFKHDLSNLTNENSNQTSQSNVMADLSSQINIETSETNFKHDLSNLTNENSNQTSQSNVMADLSGQINIETSETRIQIELEPTQSLPLIPPTTNLIESHNLESSLLINFGPEDETEQPHSIIVTEVPNAISSNVTHNSQCGSLNLYDSHELVHAQVKPLQPVKVNGETKDTDENIKQPQFETENDQFLSKSITDMQTELVPAKFCANEIATESIPSITTDLSSKILPSTASDSTESHKLNETAKGVEVSNKTTEFAKVDGNDIKVNGNGVNIATVNFISETFEELLESNVDDADCKNEEPEDETSIASPVDNKALESKSEGLNESKTNGETESHKVVTGDFLRMEKNFCQRDSYLPLLSDIRFTGPASEIMSTSFSQDSPTSPTSPECEQDSKPPTVADMLKEWDSDSDSHSSNSSSGEFIWKDGDGHETSVVPTTHFDHQRSNGAPPADNGQNPGGGSAPGSEGSGGSCSGSEGDEVEFVPSSWDCRAEPSKSSLRSLDQASLESAGEKKRVVFKRQRYHCVYEYPREAVDAEPVSPAYLPDLSTYSEWNPSSVDEAELCYGHLFSMPSYPMQSGIAIGSDYDEDFFISSSARPFESSLGVMSTTSQFFPGMHVKPMMEPDDYPPPLQTTLVSSRTPSLDLTTPDSGVEDITPGSTTDDEKKIPETEPWAHSPSSSESVSPSSPGNELGGLRHTRDKLKLDLPPSPHIPSPRHSRVFNFVLDKPKRREPETPLVMTDETPVTTTALPLSADETPAPEPTFSTFGKTVQKVEPEQKIILAEDTEVKDESKVVEPVKGEGTVLDSGDEDSGIESSSKATLERKTNVS